MRLQPRGIFTVDLIDRATGRIRQRRRVSNAFTTAGLDFLASALAAGSSSSGLHPNNSALRCRILRTSSDTQGGFTSSIGPMTANVRVDTDGNIVQTGGTAIGYLLPNNSTPIRVTWYDASDSVYDLWGAQLRDGSTILSSAEFEANSFTEKTATDILRVQYEVSIGSAGGIEQAAPVERRIAGFSSTAFAGSVDHDDGGTSSMMIDSTTSTGAVCEVELSYANTLEAGETINDERVNGFTLSIGSGTIIDHDASTENNPAPNMGALAWRVSFTFSATASSSTLAVTASPSALVGIPRGGSRDVVITGSGGSGSWSIVRSFASGSPVFSSTITGSGPTWTIQVSGPNAGGNNTLNVTVTRGTMSRSIAIPVQADSA